MMTHIKVTITGIFLFILSLGLVSTVWGGGTHYHGGGATHYHGGGGYGPGPGRYYDRGGFYFGGGWGWPNVVINVPVERPRYYVRNCENMEVCDSYGQCWLERYCD